MKVEIDEALLQNVANVTDGKYFRATDNSSLEKVYSEIDQLEKSKIDVTEFRKKKEEFLPIAVLAFILLLLETLSRLTIFRSIP
jgi:Ca-activated chloride channel family protein